MKICDTHVHIGYYHRKGHKGHKRQCGRCYYSPRKICSILKGCGVDEFIYSSARMQDYMVDYEPVNAEMFELQKLFGTGAHPFLLVADCGNRRPGSVSELMYGFYEGVELDDSYSHRWIKENRDALEEVLSAAEKFGKPVMIHVGYGEDAISANYTSIIEAHQQLRFAMVGWPSVDEAEKWLAASRNVFVDFQYMFPDDICRLVDDGWRERLLWGSDLPSYPARCGLSPTRTMRDYVRTYKDFCDDQKVDLASNFRCYLKGGVANG